jgi:CRP-like cAMP-binding protein
MTYRELMHHRPARVLYRQVAQCALHARVPRGGQAISRFRLEWPQMAESNREIAGMESRTFEVGEVIFRQGAAGQREAYLVHDGIVEVRRRTPDGERLLRTLTIGDLLGEVALFGDAPHSATALAIERVTLLVVPASRLEHLVRTKPNLAIAIIRQLARMAAAETNRA